MTAHGRFGGISATLVKYKGYRFRAEVADTLAKRIGGLSGREKLGKDEAMLFVFEKSKRYSIWMQGMKFSIDILWLGGDKRVVHMAENAGPCRFIIDCRQYTPGRPAKYVLEVNAGTARRIGVRKGDRMDFG